MKVSILMTTLLLVCSLIKGQSESFIHIDQFGYLPSAKKVAVISNPQIGFNSNFSFTPSSILEVRKTSDDSVVFTGSPIEWNGGATHVSSGDKGWWFDFSSLTTEGEYYIIDNGSNESTGPFVIGDTVYSQLLKTVGRMYYYNRCNAPKAQPYAESSWVDLMNFEKPLQDYNCRSVFDQGNPASEKDLSGGWFDAGDYNKYVTFVHTTIHNLLRAYEENPQAFQDNWNIPESGNGIPDIIDEVKWELDWLLKMNNPDGSTHIKMGSINHSQNSSSPPSVNDDPRYYGPVCTSASIAVASMFAHASSVFAGFPGMSTFANTLKSRAISSWNYVLPLLELNNLDVGCDNGEIVAGDADWDANLQKEKALVAASHLFALTGNQAYADYFETNVNDAENFANSYWAGYKTALNDAFMLYTKTPGANAALSQQIINGLTNAAQNNWEGFFGTNDDDLYRAYMPEWAYHWGSNLPKAGFGILNLLAENENIIPSSSNDFNDKAHDQLHYFHGVNPLNMVQLSNMYAYGAENCVNEIYHAWFNDGTEWDNALSSAYGPAPGFLTGGPNKDYTMSISPPAGEPNQKSYKDWNTGFPENSWEITEPAVYYQAYYLRLLSHFVNNEVDFCATGASIPAPIELSMTDLGIQYKLEWEPINGTIGCQIKGGFVGGSDPASLIVLAPNASEKLIYKNQLILGQEYQWKVRCGCVVGPPAVVGPFSEYEYFIHN